jgi:hypothetical protein
LKPLIWDLLLLLVPTIFASKAFFEHCFMSLGPFAVASANYLRFRGILVGEASYLLLLVPTIFTWSIFYFLSLGTFVFSLLMFLCLMALEAFVVG